ncbi:MAG: cation:dicarboxylase symporter family transporter [Xanthobacteraceae bacterium]
MTKISSSASADSGFSLKTLSKSVNRPSITVGAIAIALALGAMRLPFLQYLRPVGDFYIALLKICVLPFLLSTIPLAVRSAMASGSAAGTLRSLVVWLVITIAAVAAASVIVTSVIFSFALVDDRMIANIGALVGQSPDRMDVEFAVDPQRSPEAGATAETGIFSVIPTNIFASLSANDSLRVLSFALVFGIGMVMTERESGHSIFGALRHVQAVCITIFDWFSLLVPIGIVALIAPQVAQLGADAFRVLALFVYAFLATAFLLLSVAILLSALSLHVRPGTVFAALLKPMMLGASTRNTLVCIPIALEALKEDLKVKREACDLFIPLGFATVRFGTILYFVVATLFVGILMGRSFSLLDLCMVAVFSTLASFATLGLNGVSALSPLAVVLRPFGLSYEVAVPLMIVVDPIAELVRVMVNVTMNCMVAMVATGREAEVPPPVSFSPKTATET